MNIFNWAENEVKLAKQTEGPDDDYVNACYKSALDAFRTLCNDGHSGLSIQITKNILDRLIDCKPLIPITEKDFTEESNSFDFHNLLDSPEYLAKNNLKSNKHNVLDIVLCFEKNF